MKTGLFEMLLGRYSDGSPMASTSSHDARMKSIIGNLTHLLNARRGSLPHLPDYGLPDLGTVYRKMPESIDDLRTSIQETVTKYEPRLSRVRARPQISESDATRLLLVLTAELDGERVRFTTTFSSKEGVEVQRYQRRD